MNYLVIDLEMCNVPRDYRSRSYKYANETIQIGAVLLDEEFKRIGTLSQYVHPEHGVIDPFIQNLTGIRNSQVKKAPRIEEALLHMIDWIGDRGLNISLDTPVYYICRRVLADNTPVLFSTDIVPCSLFGTTRTDGIDFTRPIFDILDEACGIQISSTITHLRAAMGDPAVRHALALQRDQALLELSETCYSRLCRPVLRCRTFYTDFFDFALVRKLV